MIGKNPFENAMKSITNNTEKKSVPKTPKKALKVKKVEKPKSTRKALRPFVNLFADDDFFMCPLFRR